MHERTCSSEPELCRSPAPHQQEPLPPQRLACVQDNVSHAFVVRVSNADEAMHAYVARQALQHACSHLDGGSDLLLATCTWAIGEFGELLDGSESLLEGEAAFDGSDMQHAAVDLLRKLTDPLRSSTVRPLCPVATVFLVYPACLPVPSGPV